MPNQNPPEERPAPSQVAKKLKEILYSATEPREWVRRLIEWGFRRLTPEKLMSAIETNYNPLLIAFNHFHLQHPLVEPIARLLLKMYWDIAEEYLLDVNRVRATLSEDPEIEKLVSTPEGINYLNRVVPHCYDFLYSWTWER